MRIKDEEQIEKRRDEILEEAKKLMVEQGLETLSMRKLADRIHMTPGILYHYFANKEALMKAIVSDGYQDILAILRQTNTQGLTLDETIYAMFYAYIKGMLERQELYSILMNAKYPSIAAQTQMLKEGLSQERSSIQMLCGQIEEGKRQGIYICENVERRAQCIWCGVYGLIDRIIKEQVKGKQQERLIQEQLKMLIGSLRYVK